MTLLFITQKLHTQDVFTILWVRAFMKRGYRVIVLCLEDRGAPDDIEVVSLRKEQGYSRVFQVFRFWVLVCALRYDRVFIHMSPIWGLLGSLIWVVRRTPVYLWYTHYHKSISMRVTGWISKRLFCATPQSLPQYKGSPKKIVTGHGIDMNFWVQRKNRTVNPYELLVVHRLSRSKRLEICIRALTLLSDNYTMVIYGIEAERDYVDELTALVNDLSLGDRVTFKGTTPMETLPEIYASHQLILNMASETIDKTMLEAMTCGCYPVTTRANADAIGIPIAPLEDTPEAVARFIQSYQNLDPNALFQTVSERHSLTRLVEQMDHYIQQGA